MSFRFELQLSPWMYSFYLFIFVNLDLHILGMKRTFCRNIFLCLIFFYLNRMVSIYLSGRTAIIFSPCFKFQMYPEPPRLKEKHWDKISHRVLLL